VLLSLATLLAICGEITPAHGATSRPGTTGTAASNFVVTPNVVAKTCNGGHGAALDTHGARQAVVTSGTLSDATTLVAFSQIYPGQNHAVLDSITSRCAANSAFGDGGTATIQISPAQVPTGNSDRYLWINAVAARIGGGAIVAGTYRNRWVVGAITRTGQLDPTFGNDGWTALPLRGQVETVVQESTGRIIVGGGNNGGGCCTVNHAAALSPKGQLDTSFGNAGTVTLPTGEDSGVASIAELLNGDLLAQVAYGNMGCWGDALAMLTPSGRPVAGFAQRISRFWRANSFGAFVGDAYVDHNGFTLVGTGQGPCADGPKPSAKSATGLLARFTANGAVVGHAVRFPSPLYGGIAAFKHGTNVLVAEASYADAANETLRVLRPNGSAVKTFGNNGALRIHSPWRDAEAALLTPRSTLESSPRTLEIIATEDGHDQLQAIRVDL
jgi:hypothetical protein